MVKLGRKEAFNFLIFHTIRFHTAEKKSACSYQYSRLLVCVSTFLLADKFVYGLLAFDDACFMQFLNQKFPHLQDTKLNVRLKSSSIFEIGKKINL